MINQKAKQNIQDQRGFTLFFAVLAATLVLSVGAAIISVAVRQVLLSGTGRESQYAFYAANTGIECALYWDLQASSTNASSYVFPTSSEATISDSHNGKCVGVDLEQIDNAYEPESEDHYGVSDSDPTSATTHFRLKFDEENRPAEYTTESYFNNIDRPAPSYCVDVEVRKYRQNDPNLLDADGNEIERIYTTIISQGYNTCEDGPRRIQRGLDLTY